MDRCEKLLKETGCAALITSDENVFYYSGFTGGDSFLLIGEDIRMLFTDGRYTIQAKLEAPAFDIIDNDVMTKLKSVVEDKKIDVVGIEEGNMTVANMGRFASLFKMIPIGKKIGSLRAVKDEEELLKIEMAQSLSEKAFNYFLENFTYGMTEVEGAALLEGYLRKNGARKMSFETIVASGIRSAMPHAIAENVKVEKGCPIVIDFGCVLDNYCSDMTRTVFLGYADDKYKEIYEITKEANLKALKGAKAGMKGNELDFIARDVIEKAGYGEYFCHSLGHGVGLLVHEEPRVSRMNEEALLENMTVTIEPGIYIADFGGVRIEDLVIIKSDGIKNLNKASKELIII